MSTKPHRRASRTRAKLTPPGAMTLYKSAAKLFEQFRSSSKATEPGVESLFNDLLVALENRTYDANYTRDASAGVPTGDRFEPPQASLYARHALAIADVVSYVGEQLMTLTSIAPPEIDDVLFAQIEKSNDQTQRLIGDYMRSLAFGVTSDDEYRRGIERIRDDPDYRYAMPDETLTAVTQAWRRLVYDQRAFRKAKLAEEAADGE